MQADRQEKDNMNTDCITIRMEDIDIGKLCGAAEDIAFDVTGEKLNMDSDCLMILDRVVECFSELKYAMIAGGDEELLYLVAAAVGIYTGEYMLRHSLARKGFRWMIVDNEPGIFDSDGALGLYPVSRVYDMIINDAPGALFPLQEYYGSFSRFMQAS